MPTTVRRVYPPARLTYTRLALAYLFREFWNERAPYILYPLMETSAWSFNLLRGSDERSRLLPFVSIRWTTRGLDFVVCKFACTHTNSNDAILETISAALSPAQQTGFPRVSFAEPVPNVTVAVGRDAALSCVVDNLGSHRVKSLSAFIKKWIINSAWSCKSRFEKGRLGPLGSTNDPNDPPSSSGPYRPLQRLLRPPAHLALAHPRGTAGRRRPLHVPSQLGADDQPSGSRSRCRCVYNISQYFRNIHSAQNCFSVMPTGI